MRSVATILRDYDEDKAISVHGTGARFPRYFPEDKVFKLSRRVNACFALNYRAPQLPEVNDVDGLLEVYRDATPELEVNTQRENANFSQMVESFCDSVHKYYMPADMLLQER